MSVAFGYIYKNNCVRNYGINISLSIMSSGQWEVVGKSKKSQNGKVKQDEKKQPKSGPKLEDVGKFTA